ncbi:MAG: dethiobiotin synthase [Bacteroidales bacterium]|nr:dethiobiotin synthase [Bacteroidales bacterium]
MKGTYFISGIDTNIGKTIATGYVAVKLMKKGVNVITQKMIQTGNVGYSEDIDLHRKIMGIDYTVDDKEGLTAPQIFSYPCSPHLAARIDKKPVDISAIEDATKELEKRYDVVLLEGAGGLMVPVTEDFLTIDYIKKHNYPLIFVTGSRLGSLNHTLLNFEVLKNKGINLYKVIYNKYPKGDSIIEADSLEYIKNYLSKNFPTSSLEIMEEINK